MKHILDHLPPIDHATICGKGPSFSAFDVEQAGKHGSFIVSINEQFDLGPLYADMCIFNDWRVIHKFQQTKLVDRFVCPIAPHANVTPNDLTVENIIDYGKFFEENADKLYCYDMHQMYLFPDKPIIQSAGSTAEAAIHILALHGCKNFHFIGVGDMPAPPQYAACQPHYRRLKKQHGLTYTGAMI